jgi:hypothetical protein
MPGVGAAKKQKQFVSTNKAYVPARAMTDVVGTARLCQYWHEDTVARASVRAHTCTMHKPSAAFWNAVPNKLSQPFTRLSTLWGYLMVSVEPATVLAVMSAPRMLSMAVVSAQKALTAVYEL